MGHRPRRSLTPKVGLQSLFESLTSSRYSNMQARARKAGAGLPFTLAEFRAWMLEQFGGSCESVARCLYCTAILNIQTLRTDHRDPVKYGGAWGLSNLAASCDDCNRKKGAMSEASFRLLIEWARALPPRDSADLFSRLKMGSGYRRLQIEAFKKSVKPAAPAGLFIKEDPF